MSDYTRTIVNDGVDCHTCPDGEAHVSVDGISLCPDCLQADCWCHRCATGDDDE